MADAPSQAAAEPDGLSTLSDVEEQEEGDESAPLQASSQVAATASEGAGAADADRLTAPAWLTAAQATATGQRLSLFGAAVLAVLVWEALLRPSGLGASSRDSGSVSAGKAKHEAALAAAGSQAQHPPAPALVCPPHSSDSGAPSLLGGPGDAISGGSGDAASVVQPGSVAAAEAAAAAAGSAVSHSTTTATSSTTSFTTPAVTSTRAYWSSVAASWTPACHHPRLSSAMTDEELISAVGKLCGDSTDAGGGSYPASFLAAPGVSARAPLAPAPAGEDAGGILPPSSLVRLSTQTLARLRVLAMKRLTGARREAGRNSASTPASSSWPTQSVLSFEASPAYADPYSLASRHAVLLTPYYLTWGAFDALVTTQKVCRMYEVAAGTGDAQEAAAGAAPWAWADLLDGGVTVSPDVDASALLQWMSPATAGDYVSTSSSSPPVSPVHDEDYAPGTLRGEVVRRAALALAAAAAGASTADKAETLGGSSVPRSSAEDATSVGKEWVKHLAWTSGSAGLKKTRQGGGGGEGQQEEAAGEGRRAAVHHRTPPLYALRNSGARRAASGEGQPPADASAEPFEVSPTLACLANWDELYPPEEESSEEEGSGTSASPAVHRCGVAADAAPPPPPQTPSRFPSPCLPSLPFPALDHLVHELHADLYYRGSVGPLGAATAADEGSLPVLVQDNARRRAVVAAGANAVAEEEGEQDMRAPLPPLNASGLETFPYQPSSRALAADASDPFPPLHPSLFHLPDTASAETSTNLQDLLRLPRLPGWYFHNAAQQHAAWGGATGSAAILGDIYSDAPTTKPSDPGAAPVLEVFAPPGTNLAVQQLIASFNSLMGDAGDTFSAADPRASFLRVSGCTIAGDPRRRAPSETEVDEAAGLSLSYGDNFYHFTEGATQAYPVVEWLRSRAVTTTPAAREAGTGLTLYYWLHPPYEGFLSLTRLPLRNLMHAGKADARCRVCYMVDKGLCQDHALSAALSGRDIMRHTLNLRAAAARGGALDGRTPPAARPQLLPGGLLALRPGRVAQVWDAALAAPASASTSIVGVFPPPRVWVEPCCSSRRQPPLVLLIRRRGAGNRIWANWPDLIEALLALPIRLEVFDSEHRLSAEETAAQFAAADAVVAVHGAGMSHCLAMRRGATLIEVGPGGGASGCPCFTRVGMTNQLRYHSLLASTGPVGEPAPLPEPIVKILRADLGLPAPKS